MTKRDHCRNLTQAEDNIRTDSRKDATVWRHLWGSEQLSVAAIRNMLTVYLPWKVRNFVCQLKDILQLATATPAHTVSQHSPQTDMSTCSHSLQFATSTPAHTVSHQSCSFHCPFIQEQFWGCQSWQCCCQAVAKLRKVYGNTAVKVFPTKCWETPRSWGSTKTLAVLTLRQHITPCGCVSYTHTHHTNCTPI